MWFCYILRSTKEEYKRQTYIGSTNHPWRRLRQHNEIISGGAKFTHGKGGAWEIYALLGGFPNHVNALSCEWRLKHPTGRRKRSSKYSGVQGRIRGLNVVLKLDKWTLQCTDSNSESKFKLWIRTEVEAVLERAALPPNIEIESKADFSEEFLLSLAPPKKPVKDKEDKALEVDDALEHI